jgi:hypothetical protein
MLSKLKSLLGLLPLWAYGIECSLCQKTFNSPHAHYEEVINRKLENKHKDKIPALR